MATLSPSLASRSTSTRVVARAMKGFTSSSMSASVTVTSSLGADRPLYSPSFTSGRTATVALKVKPSLPISTISTSG